MELKYLTIGIKGMDINQVREALINEDIGYFMNCINGMNGIEISIEDLREDFTNMKNFLKDNNLKDSNPFFNDFDIDSFGLKVDFNIRPNTVDSEVLEPIVFMLGKDISRVLKTDCIVMFENMQIPIGLFKNGTLIDVFDYYNEQYFRKKVWKPKKKV